MAAASDSTSAAAAALPLQQRRTAQQVAGIRAVPTANPKVATSSPESKSAANHTGSLRVTSPANTTPKVLYPGTPSPANTLYTDACPWPSFGVPAQELRMVGAQPTFVTTQPTQPTPAAVPAQSPQPSPPQHAPPPHASAQHAPPQQA
eukprot:CAMPEP_0176132340 /NCGR_PEP_ID=MMETSP0120_2-20121206/67025_1 /TAXON_ID=160619 /ORGANISM="Kryptoperidinium foliaceum, Strain CCMP 1326" /LENGTH=147 /DNA_ID=CAMNT_0017467783 /DNA_START=23 /DNA_END=463 /DNA_ORIENTATION=+